MSKILYGLMAGLLLFSRGAFAIVRSITVDENAMAEIHLAMGRSTVLHFLEKPVKVIAGNQNYFNIEFTGQDLTIQPLGPVTSNLFAYGEYHRYGFVLRVGEIARYDDLVQVRWRGSSLLSRRTGNARAESANPKKTLKRNGVSLCKAFSDSLSGLNVIEFQVDSSPGSVLVASGIAVSLSQQGKEITVTQLAFDSDRTSAKKQSLRGRLFFRWTGKGNITLEVKYQGKRVDLQVPSTYFS